MKFSNAAIAALSAACRLQSMQAVTASTAALPPIGRFELIPVGDVAGDVAGDTPFLKLQDIGTFTGKIYIEAAPGKDPQISLYSAPANDDDPCDAGDAIGADVSKASVPVASPYVGMKHTSDGELVAVTFSLGADFRNSQIYSGNGEGRGVAKVCIRVALMSDFDPTQDGSEVVSYVDAQLTVNIDDTGTFGTFQQEVELLSSTKLMQTETIQNNVPVEAFLCGTEDVNDGRPIVEKYKIGQDFKICVRPTSANPDYKVVGFRNVFCGIEADGSGGIELVDESGDLTSDLSIVTLDVEESMDKDGNPMGGSAGAFESVVTASYFDDAADSFQCTGEAVLEYVDPGQTCDLVVSYPFQLNDSNDKYAQMAFCVKGSSSASIFIQKDGSNEYSVPGAGYKNVGPIQPTDKYTEVHGLLGMYNPDMPQRCLGPDGDFLRYKSDTLKYDDDPDVLKKFRVVVQAKTAFPVTMCVYTLKGSKSGHYEAYYPFDQSGWTKTTSNEYPEGVIFAGNQHYEYCKTLNIPPECTTVSRRLTASFSSRTRGLQEGSPEEPGIGSFVTNVGLSSEGRDSDINYGPTAPAHNADFGEDFVVAVAAAMGAVAVAAI